MKKLTGIIGVIVALMLIMSGCGSKDASANSNSTPDQAASGTNKRGQFKRPDLMGQVTMIAGNQVTIKVIEMPQRDRNQGQGNGQNQSQGSSQSQGNGQQQGQGQFQGGGQGQSGQGQSQRREIKFTGETKTITIPVGVPITTITRGQNGMQVQNIEFKDIKKGNTMQIWYSDKNKEAISRISISSFKRN